MILFALMKVLYEDVKLASSSSINLLEGDAMRLDVPYHKHSQYELALILEGMGTRIVGDSITSFKAADIVLYGINLPHSYISKTDSKRAHSLVLQFAFDLSETNIPELAPIMRLLKASLGGLKFSDKTFREVLPYLKEMQDLGVFPKFITLLKILDILSKDKSTKLLSPTYAADFNEDVRLLNAKKFIRENFKNKVSIVAAAKVSCLCEGAFRKAFKECYGISPKKYLINLRLNEACRLLDNTRKTVLEIAFECGFENIANFNRRFKENLGLGASLYRRRKA